MNTSYQQLWRSTSNRMIAGVCGSLGEYSNMDPTLIRLGAVLLLLFAGPGIAIAYWIVALIVPERAVEQPQ